MDTSFEQKVRERAYHIWMSAGMTHGMAHEHWIVAERAVADEIGTPTAAASAGSGAKKAAVKAAPGKRAPVRKASVKSVAPRGKAVLRPAKTNAPGSTASH